MLLAITIALTIRAVGILLVNGFLVVTAVSARLICQQFVPFLATAGGIGATSGLMGIVISGAIDLPSGLSIVLVQLFGFLAVALWCRQGRSLFHFGDRLKLIKQLEMRSPEIFKQISMAIALSIASRL